MLDQTILDYATEKGLHKRTLERWLQLSIADQESLLELAQTLKLGENHFRDFLDWLEEISLRDGISLVNLLKGEAFSRILSDPRLGRSDKLKSAKEELRRLRFPRLSRIEDEIQSRIRDLKLKPQIQMSVPPGLEGGFLTVQLKAMSFQELKRQLQEVEEALEREEMREIFALVQGRTIEWRLKIE